MPAFVLSVIRFVGLLLSGHQAIAIENAALRLQLAAFRRKRKRPVLTWLDRLSDCRTCLSSRRDCTLANPARDNRVLQQVATSNIHSALPKPDKSGRPAGYSMLPVGPV